MHRFQKDTQAVSVIIGALMLTVIVVSAATAFAIFTSQKQKELLDAEYAKLRRDLEELKILAMQDLQYDSSDKLQSVSFKLANLHADDSVLSSLQLNNNYVRHISVLRQDGTREEWQVSATTGAFRLGGLYALDTPIGGEPYIFFDKDKNHEYSIGDIILDLDYDKNGIEAKLSYGQEGGLIAFDTSNNPYIFQDKDDNKKYTPAETIIDSDPDKNSINANPNDGEDGKQLFPEYYHLFKIQSREQITITISDVSSDVYLTTPIYQNDAITFSIYTSLVKEFTKTFIPPTAIIKIDTESLPAGTPYYILDGSASDHPGDGFIIRWQWTITDISTIPPSQPASQPYGRKTQVTDTPPTFIFGRPGDTYEIILTVTDNYGMTGSTTFMFTP